jgi:6-phosphofructokinase 1
VVGIPKTIDNDCDCVDRSFGFTTAVQQAVSAIKSAAVEAQSALNCIGLVKLMGRHAGFIAAHATLASGDPDLCLIPEVRLPLQGENGLLTHLEEVLQRQGHAVVVVAEGAGGEYLSPVLNSNGAVATDAGGNTILPEVGPWLRSTIMAHFKGAALQPEVSVKYIDPSYIIRSVPANASDSLYCLLLAQNAVHGAMAGFTGFSVGLYNNRMVYLPMELIVRNSPRVMNPLGRTWERVVSVTGQPSTVVPLHELAAFTNTAKTVF